MENPQIMTMVLPVAVPYATSAIKKIWNAFDAACPIWMKPFRPLIAGWIVAALSRAIGVQLPTDLGHITDGDVMSIATSGVVIGGIGAWLNDMVNGIRKHFGPETWQGKLIRLIAGSDPQLSK